MPRPRKPLEQKLAAGNPGKRALPVPLISVPGIAAIPDAPDDLDAAGAEFWADVWVAGHAWLSPQLDYATVELAARTFDEVHRLRASMRAGMLLKEPITSASGKVVGDRFVAHPAAKMLRDAERQLERWLVVLAIPPTARAALGLIRVTAQSTLEDLLKSRHEQPVGGHVIDAETWE